MDYIVYNEKMFKVVYRSYSQTILFSNNFVLSSSLSFHVHYAFSVKVEGLFERAKLLIPFTSIVIDCKLWSHLRDITLMLFYHAYNDSLAN